MAYFIVVNGQQQGPFEIDALLAAGLTKSTLVWREGMSQWQPASQVAELAYLFPPAPFCPPPVGGNGTTAPSKPDGWLGWNIAFVIVGFTLCGVIPGIFGILGVVAANESDTLWHAGRYAEAETRAANARRWAKVSGIVILVELVLVVLCCLAVVALGICGAQYC